MDEDKTTENVSNNEGVTAYWQQMENNIDTDRTWIDEWRFVNPVPVVKLYRSDLQPSMSENSVGVGRWNSGVDLAREKHHPRMSKNTKRNSDLK